MSDDPLRQLALARRADKRRQLIDRLTPSVEPVSKPQMPLVSQGAAALCRARGRGSCCSTFASNALAAGSTVFELARVMGTSVAMIERHYGTLLDGAHAGIVGRLESLEAQLDEQAAEQMTGRGSR